MGPAVNGLTTPAAVLALQRSAGNAAVTRALLARDETEKTKVSGAGDFTATGGEPKGEGVTTVGKDPADATKAKAVAPKVTMPATVKLNPGKTLGGETGQLGHIQNLTSSTRGGTYRKGGDPRWRGRQRLPRGALQSPRRRQRSHGRQEDPSGRDLPVLLAAGPDRRQRREPPGRHEGGHLRPARVQAADRERRRAADELRGPGRLPARGGRQDQLRGLQVRRVHVVGQLGRRGRQGDERRRRGAREGQGQAGPEPRRVHSATGACARAAATSGRRSRPPRRR